MMRSKSAENAPCIMVQGTASSVGKSLLVTALCRILRQDGYNVAPFKAQNMALNSFVTREGLEIGRAQAVQAEAAGLAPSVEMNPILLKPEADARCQVVVRGKPAQVLEAATYYQYKDELWPVVVESLASLRRNHEVVVIEGAGSPAEINLRDGDIVNMRVAKEAQAPVLLVGDIDRGGVFASLVGTMELLEPEERALVKGFAINKFRGDVSLLRPGLAFLEQRTGKPVLGVIPHIPNLRIADEDSLALERRRHGFQPRETDKLDIAIVRLPHIANFDDFDALEAERDVVVRYVADPSELAEPDLVILPGSKATRSDLAWLRSNGLAEALVTLARENTPTIGICGGFQMLGLTVDDPSGIEGPSGCERGLGLLPLATVFEEQKVTAQVQASVVGEKGILTGLAGVALSGYEIHMGRRKVAASGVADENPFCRIRRHGEQDLDVDGFVSDDGSILGTYIHGLFDNSDFRRGLLANVAGRRGIRAPRHTDDTPRDREYDRLAAQVRHHLDVAQLYRWVGLR